MEAEEKRVVFCREAGGFGDVLMTLPAAKAYKRMGWHVEYLVLSGYAELVHSCKSVDAIYVTDKSHRRGRDEPIDSIYLEAHGIVEPRKTKVVDLFCPAWKHEAGTWGKPYRNRVECFWVGSGLLLKRMPENPLYHLIELEDEAPDWLPEKYLLVQRNTCDTMRNVPLEIYMPEIEKARKEGLEIMTIGHDKKEWDVADYNISELSFQDFCWTVRRASRILCGDSGILHLSSVWGVPTIAYFGPTNGRLICRSYPLATAVQCRECGPCYYHDKRGWTDCRNTIEVCKAWDISESTD